MRQVSGFQKSIAFIAFVIFLINGFSAPRASAQADTFSGSATTTSTPDSGTQSQLPLSTQNRGFFTRLGHAYIDDWTASNLPPAPEPQRRGTPAPLNSPPFPSADWPIGGTPVIGAPDYQTYMLMQAVNRNETRFKIYGWFSIGYNASTSNKGKFANAPAAYDVIPNSIQLDQAALYFERLPDTVQKDHFDWGFRFASIYGLDYRYTTAAGVFSQQLLQKNNTYGYDPVMYLHGFLSAAYRQGHGHSRGPVYFAARYRGTAGAQ